MNRHASFRWQFKHDCPHLGLFWRTHLSSAKFSAYKLPSHQTLDGCAYTSKKPLSFFPGSCRKGPFSWAKVQAFLWFVCFAEHLKRMGSNKNLQQVTLRCSLDPSARLVLNLKDIFSIQIQGSLYRTHIILNSVISGLEKAFHKMNILKTWREFNI